MNNRWRKTKDLLIHLVLSLPFLMLAALVWRLINAGVHETFYDGCAFIMIARNVLHGHLATPYINKEILYFYEPLYPAAIALFSFVSDNLFYAARLANVLAGVMLIIPVYGFTKELYGRTAAFYAGALVVTNPFLVILSSNAYSEPYFMLFVAFGMWWLWRAMTRNDMKWSVAAGFVIGLSYLTRSQGISLAAGAVAGILAVQVLFRRLAWKRFVILLLLFLIGYAAATTPYHTYLYIKTGSPSVGGKFRQEFFKKNVSFGEHDWLALERTLNQEGTRFLWQDTASEESILTFIREHKALYARRVLRDFGSAVKFIFSQKKVLSLLVAVLLFVQVASDIKQKRNMDILLFLLCIIFTVAASLAVSAVIVDRYVSVVIPFTLVMAGGGTAKLEAFFRSVRSNPEIPAWVYRRLPVLLTAVCFLGYPFGSVKNLFELNQRDPDKIHKAVAKWITPYLDPQKQEIIMAFAPFVPAYTGDIFFMMPAEDIVPVTEYARRQGADYILVDEQRLSSYHVDPEMRERWITGKLLPDGLRFVEARIFGERTFALYRLKGETPTPPAADFAKTLKESKEEAAQAGRLDRLNVILISLDTLRADHLGCYAYHRKTSPAIDAIADAGVRFANVISQAPKTAPSHMTMMTSLYPSEHRVHWIYGKEQGVVLSRKWETLAEVFKRNGYATAAFTAGREICTELGFDRGFDYFDESLIEFNPENLFRAATWTEIQAKKGIPSFLFLHTYQIHDPYTPPPPYNTMFDPNYDGPIIGDIDKLRVLAEKQDFFTMHRLFWRLPPDVRNNDLIDTSLFSSRDIEHLVALYDGAICYTDSVLKAFFSSLKDKGLLSNTLIILTADHGEEFAEHGKFLHRFLYRETLHVPLIMYCPGVIPEGKVVHEPVQLLDVLPTILDIVKIPCPSQARGISLLPLIRGEKMVADRIFYSEEPWYLGDLHQSVRAGHYFLYNKGGQIELYDIRKDPAEQENLANQLPDIAKNLRNQMNSIREEALASIDQERQMTR